MKKLFKMMFYSTLMIGTMIAISSSSWLGMWLGLEINLLSIIPLMTTKKNILSNESAMKYFITQAIASTIILFSALIMMTSMNTNFDTVLPSSLIMDSALLTKMGAAPFHFWFPEVMEGLQWMNCLIMLTWQKIAPMIILMYNMTNMIMITMIIVTSMSISGIMGLNQTSLRKILTYSSINHIGWMLASMMFIQKIWTIYFLIYSIITINLILMFNLTNSFTIKQMFSLMNSNNLMKILFSLNFFSLGGLPPFLGFFPKWLTIQILIENQLYMLTFTMTILTLLTLYFYMRIAFTALLLSKSENNWNLNLKMKNPLTLNFMIFNFSTITGLIMCTPWFNMI